MVEILELKMKQTIILRLTVILLLATIVLQFTRMEDKGTEALTPQPVRCLQKALIDLGYDCGEFAPDGVVGPKTLASWKHWDMMNAGLVEEAWSEIKGG